MSDDYTNAGRDVAAVVVTYHAAPSVVDLLKALRTQCGDVIVVDNGSTQDEVAAQDLDVHLIELGENMGIATAQNRGIALARERGARYVLLSDHDSLPPPGMVATLVKALTKAQQRGPVAGVGPIVRENRQGNDVLVFVARKWGPRRASAVELTRELIPVAFLIASGSLLDLGVIERVGLMNDGYFVDHVDLEWGLRATRQGYRMFAVRDTVMEHSLGDDVVVLRGRAQPVHVHTPVRNYYLVRNTIALVRSGLLPRRWRAGYLVWLGKYLAFNSLAVGQGRQRRRLMAKGFRDGVRGIDGRVRQT